MGDLPVGKSERLGLGEFVSVQRRHGEIKVAIVSRNCRRVSSKMRGGKETESAGKPVAACAVVSSLPICLSF